MSLLPPFGFEIRPRFRETLIKYHKNKAGFSTPQNCPKAGNSAALEMTGSELIRYSLARERLSSEISNMNLAWALR